MSQRERSSRWRATNPEKAREPQARLRAAHPETERERHRRYYAENRDKVRACDARYHNANPARKMFQSARKRSRKFGTFDNLTFEQLEAYLDQHDGRCDLCGVEFEGKGDAPRARTLEHLRPFQDGGENSAANIALSCWTCNVGNRHPERRETILRSRLQRAA